MWRDLVIVGNGVADRLIYPNDPPGDVQAFDVRSGKRAWSCSPVPRDDATPPATTWENESWKITGHTNVWAPFSVDDARGLVYLPGEHAEQRLVRRRAARATISSPSRSCVSTREDGQAQVGIPDRASRTVGLRPSRRAGARARSPSNGKSRDIVAVPTKTGFLFVFDRVTGKPIWPIEERSVPASDVPGEKASQSQPFPTKPKPFAKQGFGFDDLIDFTPEIKARALEEIEELSLRPDLHAAVASRERS